MILSKRLSDGILLAAIIAALIASADVKRSHTGESSGRAGCHLATAQNPGQDPGEEEGNPTHRRPERSCSHNPTKQQVNCHCKTDCNQDGTQREDKRCRSYCHKDKCTCPRKPCE
jgi:hypothetical protein